MDGRLENSAAPDGTAVGKPERFGTALLGRRLGGYVLRRKLGEGGMGAVYVGHDVALDREVAVKVLPAALAADEDYVQRFVREARTAARLSHASIVQVHAAGTHEGIVYMAMELVPGASLADILRKHGRLPARRACEVARDVARALGAAHELGIVHRDVKTDNVLVAPGGRVKLADFGLARQTQGTRITSDGLFLGTPQYASPEQCNLGTIDGRSDLYSLGVVLFEMLSGRTPHVAPTPLALFAKITSEAPPALAGLVEGLPPSLVALVDRLLAKDAVARFQKGEEVARALDTVIDGLPPVDAAQDPIASLTVDPTAQTAAIQGGADPDAGTVELGGSPRKDTTGGTTATAAPARPPRRAPVLSVVLGLAVVATGGGVVWKLVRGPAVSQTNTPVVAVRVVVLDWVNGAKSDEFAWLEQGLQDMVASALEGIPGVAVERRAQAAAQDGAYVVSGRFYAPQGDAIAINFQIAAPDGRAVSTVQQQLKKSEVLTAILEQGQRLRRDLERALGRQTVAAAPAQGKGAAPAPALELDGAPPSADDRKDRKPPPGEKQAFDAPAAKPAPKADESDKRLGDRNDEGRARAKAPLREPLEKKKDAAPGKRDRGHGLELEAETKAEAKAEETLGGVAPATPPAAAPAAPGPPPPAEEATAPKAPQAKTTTAAEETRGARARGENRLARAQQATDQWAAGEVVFRALRACRSGGKVDLAPALERIAKLRAEHPENEELARLEGLLKKEMAALQKAEAR